VRDGGSAVPVLDFTPSSFPSLEPWRVLRSGLAPSCIPVPRCRRGPRGCPGVRSAVHRSHRSASRPS